MKEKNVNSKERGITLVALVVTVIIMLILAGITLNLVLGDNGLISMAKKATDSYKEAQAKEEESLKELSDNSYAELYKGKDDATPGEMAGKGTTKDPYLIQSIEDLVYLSNQVNGGETYEGKEIKLMLDLDFNSDDSYTNPTENRPKLTTGEGFTPIGTADNPFQGNFNGNNKTLSNLYIENEKFTKVGLFGVIWNAEINDLTITGNIHTKVTADCGGITGKLGGQKKDPTLNNVKNFVNVTSDCDGSSIGGLIGYGWGEMRIVNCSNKGNISNSNNAGGIIGANAGTLKIENCYNEGKITNTKGLHAGGIVGRDEGNTAVTTIINSHNTGSVISNTEGEFAINIGGLVGKINGTISIDGCNNSGEIKNERTEYTIVNNYKIVDTTLGGLVGSIVSGNSSTNIIKNSYNSNNVSNGKSDGGIIGRNESSNPLIIDKCYNIGDVIAFMRPVCEAGGLTGALTNASQTYILNCYNSGNIVSKEVSGITPIYAYITGISPYVNMDAKCSIINSYNVGNITFNYQKAEIHGLIYAVDNNEKGLTTLNMNNVYNIGNMEPSDNVQGIACINDTSTYDIQNAYCDDRYTPTNIDGLGTQMSMNEMKTSTFVGTLNSNRSQINLEAIDPILKDYTLAEWKQGTGGYPVLQ